MKPVWLLDIDGVLNAIARKGDPSVWPVWKSGWAAAGGQNWPILWSPAVVDFVREVVESGSAEVRWHTTWQHEAVEVERLLGLPSLAVAEAPEYAGVGVYAAKAVREGKPPWWKLPAAERVVTEEGRPLIWTDDDIKTALRDYRMAPSLRICPQQNIGLTPAHLAIIRTAITDLW